MNFSLFGGSGGSEGLAIDLGTANTLVYMAGKGIVIDEPSVVAIQAVDGTRKVYAVGHDAKILTGKTSDDIRTYRPLTDGVINDLEIAEAMIGHFIEKAIGPHSRMSRGPQIVICVPSAATSVERRAIRAAALNAGGREVWLVEEPLAAAIGAGLPVADPVGSMIVDIGGGTTEVGITSLRTLIYGNSVRVGGDKMDEAIASWVRRKHNLYIGDASAERIKQQIGSAVAADESAHIVGAVRGRHISSGCPAEVSISQKEVAEALREPIGHIVEIVMAALEHATPEIAADVIDQGIVMTGGGSLLRNIDAVIADETGLPVIIAESPLTSVVLGAGRLLEDAAFKGALCAA